MFRHIGTWEGSGTGSFKFTDRTTRFRIYCIPNVSPCALYQALDCLFVIKAKVSGLPGTFCSICVTIRLQCSPRALEPSRHWQRPRVTSQRPFQDPNSSDKTRARRRSSGLGGEIKAVDTGAPAFATVDLRPPSPGAVKAQNERDPRKPFSKQRKAKSLLQQYKRYALKHTWVTPLAILAIFLSGYAVNPTDSNPIHRFIFLSHAIPPAADAVPGTPIEYGKGRWDITFLLFYIVVLSFTREFIMQEFLRPLARRSGLKSRAKQSRFMEQMYTAIYFGVLGPCGLYVMSRTQVWYFNTKGMYEGFPHKTHRAEFKFYYLFQAAYWAQQAIVLCLGLEKPRKDFKALVGHHIVTLLLIGLSYRFHFTYMGLGVFITHDISDFFFATSKTLNYLNHPLVGPYFGFFICTWIYLRHYLNLRILYSEFYEFKTVGPYELDWEAEQYKSPLSHYISTALLASLQGLNLFWLFYIIRTAYRFVFLDNLEDARSDNDEDELAEEQRLDALAKQGVDSIAGPKVFLNGESFNGKSSATQIRTNGITNRKAL